MTKRDLSRTFWCMLAFLLGFISVTLSSVQDAMTICQRIQNNDLKIRTLGPVGDKFMLLTTEGHLFYLPKANLRDVGTSRTTLTIDQVPVSANRVFGVNLDYSVRPGYLFFLLVDGENESEFLMTLKVASEEVILRAFNLDWTQSRREKTWAARRNRDNLKLEFNPDFVVNKEKSYCAEARRIFKEEVSRGWFNQKYVPRHARTQTICLKDYSLTAEPTKEVLDSYELFQNDDISKGPTVLTSFLMGQDRFYQYNFQDDGKLKYSTGGNKPGKYHSHLRNFIRCGPNFADNTHNLEPPKNKTVARHTTTTSPSTSQSITDKQTHNDFRFLIIVTVVSFVAVLALAYFLLVKKKKKTKRGKKRVKKRNRKDSKLGSSASPGVGTSNVASSNVASSDDSTALSNSNASSGTGSSSKASKSKMRSFMDTVSSVFKKNQMKIAKQGTKVKKAKENEKKEKEKERSKK